jgi:hypothetical protein
MHPRPAIPRLLLLVLLAGCAARNPEDGSSSLPAPTGNQVLTHTFSTARGEFVRVFLASGVTYEAELDGGGLRLEVRPIDRSLQPPRVEERIPGASAGGSSVFTIQPRADGEYEFRTLGGDATRPLTLRLRARPGSGN